MNIQDPKLNTSSLFDHTASTETESALLEQQLNQMFAVPSNGKLVPDPAIQKQLLATLERKKAAQKSKLRLPNFARLLDLRIPVYQVACGVAIVLSVFLASDRWMNATTPTLSESIDSQKIVTTELGPKKAQSPQMTIIDSLLQYRGSANDTFFTSAIDSL